jgi:hypothetical protein
MSDDENGLVYLSDEDNENLDEFYKKLKEHPWEKEDRGVVSLVNGILNNMSK